MKKKTIALLAVMACAALAGCSSSNSNQTSDPVKATDGYAEGKIGTVFETAFFEYSVDDVAYADTYEDYTAADGMQLVDSTITIKNTFGEDLPMFNDDFQLQWHDLGDTEEDYCFGIIMEGSETVMPAEYTLATDKSVTYHVVFEAPADAKEFSIDFLEFFDNDTDGDIFFTYFEK